MEYITLSNLSLNKKSWHTNILEKSKGYKEKKKQTSKKSTTVCDTMKAMVKGNSRQQYQSSLVLQNKT